MSKSRKRAAALGYGLCIGVQSILLVSLATVGAATAHSAPAHKAPAHKAPAHKAPAHKAPAHSAPVQTHFGTQQQAVDTLVQAVRTQDMKTLQAALGPEGDDLLSSGDPVQDDNGRQAFLTAYDENAKVVDVTSSKSSLQIGKDDWPFPIPLVRDASGWRFDTAAGREELINRRVGRNELDVIQVSLAYVDAQREYAALDRDGDGVLEYAQRFRSTEGVKDGLYWPTSGNEPLSPLGDMVRDAKGSGYTMASMSSAPTAPPPYHGYQYKILTRQGPNAKGGALNYVIKGNMMGGFGLVAYPANYGVTGVVTFIVNHDGTVYRKDLGPRTATIAQHMTSYDPDKSWSPENK